MFVEFRVNNVPHFKDLSFWRIVSAEQEAKSDELGDVVPAAEEHFLVLVNNLVN